MVEAYILLKISTQREVYGFSRSVVEKLRSMHGVENADLLFGDYDAIVKLKATKIHDIENLVIEEISMIDGVESTVTLLCVDEGILK
ncbi:MAG: Lrp/AsnC family transcriptional regulator [Candidatus Bathyarchaeia archaeon]